MLEGEIRIEVRAGRWSVELNGAVGRRHKDVDPLQDEDLEAVPDLIEEARSWQGLVEHFSPRYWRVPLPALRQVGGLVRNRLLGWERAQDWFVAMEQKARREGRVLRFVIDLDESTAELAHIPIELAFSGSEWLFKRRREPSVRVDANLESVPLSRIRKGDRLLIATAHSDRAQYPTREELRAHAEAILKVARDAGWQAEWLEDASQQKLEAALTRGHPIDVLYVACHGEEDPERSGRLVLRGEKGDDSLTGDTLAKWASDQAERGRNLKAVLLSACSSATPGGTGSGGTAGMAQWLLKRGKVLAAMGYRKPVGITWALGFAERLLALLQQEQSLEESFAEVRWNQDDSDPQWALPLLYTRRWDAGMEALQGITAPTQQVPAGLPALRSVRPRPPRSYFTARQRELAELQQWLSAPGRAVITAVAGEGGIGKTELATVLAQECHEDGRPVIWLERPLDNLRESLLTLIRAREPLFQPPPEASDDDLATRVRNLLSPYGGLLVLDDVSDSRGLDALMPGGGWNVLVTTRTAGLLSDVRDVPLSALEPEDAARLLSLVAWRQEQVPSAQIEAALELVKELGGLPLAVEVAGDTIRTQGLTAAEYLEEFRSGRGQAGSDKDRVARVLTRSLDVLGEQARETMHALAVLPRVGASLEMVATTLGIREPEAARRLDRLVRHHLATFIGEQGLYAIHPRVRERLREEAAEDRGAWNRLHRGAAEALKNLVKWVEAAMGSSVGVAEERWRTVRARLDSTDTSAWQEGCQATGIFDPLTSLKLTPLLGAACTTSRRRRLPACVRRSSPSLLLKRGRAEAPSEAQCPGSPPVLVDCGTPRPSSPALRFCRSR